VVRYVRISVEKMSPADKSRVPKERKEFSEVLTAPAHSILMVSEWMSTLTGRRLDLVFWIALLLIAAFGIYAAPHPVHRWMLDTFLFLDGGWRILNGQRPYADFPTGIGPVPFQLIAFGMLLSGGGPAGVDLGFLSGGLILGIWCWYLGKHRLDSPAALLLALFVAVFTFAPHSIGSRPSTLTYASIYNRLGYSMLFLVVLETAIPSRLPGRQANWIGPVSSGILCALLIFVKPSFFLVAAVILLACLLFVDNRDACRVPALIAGFAAAFLAMMAYLRFDFTLVVRSLATVAASRVQAKSGDPRSDVGLVPLLKHAADKTAPFVGLLLLAWIVAALPCAFRARRLWGDWWPVAAAAVVCGIESLFLMTNGTQESVPMLGVFALLLVSQISTWYRSAAEDQRNRYGLVCGLGLLVGFVLFLPDFAGDFASLAYVAEQEAMGPRPTAYFAPSRLQTLATREVHPDWDEPSNDKYIRQVNDGLDLLRKNSSSEESIFALDYVNPFSYALARKPAIGGGPYTSGGLFNPSRMPSPYWFLGHTNILMIPKDAPYPDRVEWLQSMFGNYIQQHFAIVAESPSWLLLRRKKMN